MNTKKIFLNGINQDDAYVLVDKSEYLNAVNLRFATSEYGKAGQLSNIESNVIKNATIDGTFALPAGTNQCIGAYEDTANRRVFFFVRNNNIVGEGSYGHGIYCYDADTDLVYTVLLDGQVSDSNGYSYGLRFNSFIHSIAMVDNLLYWTDGVNQQRRINVEAAIKMNHPSYSTSVAAYTIPVSLSVITLIRNQPWVPLTINKVTDVTYVNNFIKDEAFQFAYRFVYRDGEVSTFSPLSKLANYNLASSNSNAIDVTIPIAQKIEQDVKRVEIAVKFALGGSMSVIKTFTTGFSSHNSGTAITFRFYNDTVGAAVDSVSAIKQFDSIPRTSKTLEIAKNRLFLGNNVDGYDTPTTTSLTVSTATAGAASVSGQWYKVVYRSGGVTITRYWLYITDITTNPGYYVPASQPSLPIPSTSVDYTTLTFAGGGISTIATYLGVPVSDVLALQYQGPTINITNATASSVVGSLAFKSDATYRAGVVFFDEAGRKSGVVTSESIKAVTPDRNYSTVSFVTQINWSLDNNNNPAAQIPDWATHYAIVRTKCLRTSFFAQLRADAIKYIPKDATTGEYGALTDSYLSTHFGVAVKASSLFSNGLGYAYQEGDILKLYVSGGSTYSLAVKDTYGEYIVCDLVNLGTTTSTAALYEVYSPYVGSSNEPYFEVGDIYKIDHPGENTRKFSVISGSLRGDVYILQRTIPSTHLVEAMSPNDKYWKNWLTDIGRTTIVISSGVTSKPVSVYYSNVILQGTETNGLSTFEPLSQTNLPIELKQLQRLLLTSKVQMDGTIMLAVGEQETASVYIGEAQIFDNSGNSFLATTTGVIGNVNVLRGSYGTVNPESAYKWKGDVVYFDANKGTWVRYSSNGLFPISINKMASYFRRVGQDIISYFKDPTEYNLANPELPLRVIGGADPYHEEFLCYTPKMFVSPRNTQLEDMELSTQQIEFTTAAESITLSNYSLTFSYLQGSGPSSFAAVTYTGERIIMNGSVTINGTTDFEVSKDAISFSSSITYPYTGISSSNTFFIRMKSGRTGGSYGPQNVNVVFPVIGGTSSFSINCTGTVSVPVTPTIVTNTSVLGGFTYVNGSGPSAVQSFTISASNLTPASGNITITPPADFEVSVTSSTTGFSSSPVTRAYTAGGTLAANTVWVRLKAGLTTGGYSSQLIEVSGGGATTVNITCNGIVYSSGSPTIYAYPSSGYGNSESEACSMASTGLTTLTSTSDSSTFGPGSVVYINPAGTSLLTGYTHIFMNGANWDIDPMNGVVIAYSLTQC
jgi:hypothetical protein